VKQKKRKTNVFSHDRRRESRSLKKRLNARLYEKLNEHRKQQKPRNACKLKSRKEEWQILRKERSKWTSRRDPKRRRTNLLQSRNTTVSHNLRNMSDNIDAQPPDTTVTVATCVIPAVRMRNASRRLISLPLRSERSSNLPKRSK
jgi:hypothetical protein